MISVSVVYIDICWTGFVADTSSNVQIFILTEPARQSTRFHFLNASHFLKEGTCNLLLKCQFYSR